MKRIGLGIALCLLLTACGGGLPTSQAILYEVYRDPGGESARVVYYLPDPQAVPVELLTVPGKQMSMWFSPDGQWIAVFYANEAGIADPASAVPNFQFSLETLAPNGQKRVTWASFPAHISFAPSLHFLPDNRRVVFSECADIQCQDSSLYIGELAAGTRTLKASGEQLRIMGVSPQSRILYQLLDRQARKARFFLLEPDGEPVEVTNLPETVIRQFAFSAKNEALMLTWDFKEAVNVLQIGDASLENWRVLSAGGKQASDFILSPDGSLALVLKSVDDCSGIANFALEVVDLGADSASRLGCTHPGLPVEFSPQMDEVIWADERLEFRRSSLRGAVLEEFPAGTGYMRYFADGSQIVYWYRDREAQQACLYLRGRTGGEAQKLEKTCISTRDMAAIPGFLLLYRAGR